MLLYLLVLFLIPASWAMNNSTSVQDLPKCCDFDSVFVNENNSFLCRKSDTSRVSIRVNSVLLPNETEAEECVESLNNQLYLFRVENDKPTIVENITKILFPKCCPMNFLYMTTTYSCVRVPSHTDQFNASFIKIGLSNCEITYDYKLSSEDDIQIYDDSIFFLKTQKVVPTGEYCLDKTTDGKFLVRVCQDYKFCEKVRCIHKCCPDGQSFVNGSHCKDTFIYGLELGNLSRNIDNTDDEFAVVYGYKTTVYFPTTNFHIDSKGYFHTSKEKIGNEVYSPEEETYCIEHATKGNKTYGHTIFRISPQTELLEKKFLFNRWAMIVSSGFLNLTILYYMCSKEIKKVFGKTLVSFCLALMVLFIILAYCAFKPNLNKKITISSCKTIGFLLLYTNFSCFVWLQIICYDIYWTFGSGKRFSTTHEKKRSDLKRFLFYSLYGWGMPLIMTMIPLIFHFMDNLPSLIKVRMGETKCLIERGEDNYAEMLFYITPITVIQIVNLVFFIKTIRYCLQVKADIQRMTQSSDAQKKRNKFLAQKERFGLVIKLSFIMGIFFIFEVVSSFYNFNKNIITEYIEIIWDLINCLQGLFIFVIFVCKAKHFKKCRSNIDLHRLRKISLSTASTKMTVVSSERKSSQDNRRKCSKEEARNRFA